MFHFSVARYLLAGASDLPTAIEVRLGSEGKYLWEWIMTYHELNESTQLLAGIINSFVPMIRC